MVDRRYWFPTEKPIRRGNLIVLRKLKKTKPEHGPWLVGTLDLLDKLKVINRYYSRTYIEPDIDPLQYNSALPYGEGYRSSPTMGSILEAIQDEILWGKAHLLECSKFVNERGLIGKLIPDPFSFAPQRTEKIIDIYQRNGDFQEITDSFQELLFELIEFNGLPNDFCLFLDGYSNTAYTSLEYRRGMCHNKASILAGLLGSTFETRIVGFENASLDEWATVCKEEGVRFEDHPRDMYFDMHHWIEVNGPEGWIALDTIHPSGREIPDYGVFFNLAQRLGSVCQEYVMKTKD